MRITYICTLYTYTVYMHIYIYNVTSVTVIQDTIIEQFLHRVSVTGHMTVFHTPHSLDTAQALYYRQGIKGPAI